MVEKVIAYGHEKITARHGTTIEITRDKEITKRADCVVGVNSDKGISDLSDEFKSRAKSEDSTIKVILKTDDLEEAIVGKGHPNLIFAHKNDFVIRKSDFICPRTLMIKADKSSRELDRRFVELLKDRTAKIEMYIYVEGKDV
ncbi:MAG: DUF371 domain-containing protein [Candidatus Hydrothermarchaeales archaeon]